MNYNMSVYSFIFFTLFSSYIDDKKAPYHFRVPKALYADSNRIFITICYRRASRPTAIFYFIIPQI